VIHIFFFRELFKNKTARGQESSSESDILWTKHENAIRNITKMPGSKFASSGLDGRVVVWDLAQASLGTNMASLGIR
jgi:hypothetical protein